MAGEIAYELASAGFVDAVEVGRGGGGVVYRCHQQSLGRTVAIKVLASNLDQDDQERFLREGYAMGGLSGHPNIVNILQVGMTERDRPFIVMPYHARGSLADQVRREGRIPWPDALRIGVKLCGALETAHRTGTLHRDIKPANVLVNDYGDPQLSDFGTARIVGGYKTVTGFFTGTLSYTAPEVLTGKPPTVGADVYSLGATLYALIAGKAAHERNADEELIAHYLRITSQPVPDLRHLGIPSDVCSAIEKAMSLDPAERFESAAEMGRALQEAQRHNGLTADAMAIGERAPSSRTTGRDTSTCAARTVLPGCRATDAGQRATCAPTATAVARHVRPQSVERAVEPPAPDARAPKNRTKTLIALAAAAAVVLLVIGAVVIVAATKDTTSATSTRASAPPTAEAQPGWRPISDSRSALDGAAATQSDGTIWIFGGMGTDNRVSGAHEGYDPAIDSWKGGEALPVPVQRAMSVTWQDTPVVLGGWRTEGGDTKVATDQVWRVVNSRWVALPPLLQPRAAAAAAVVGDRIVVTGGVDAGGKVLGTTEVFDGSGWTLSAPMPTPRQMLAAASDGKLIYALGGTNGTELATVEAYDPAADTWTTMPALPEPRSDFGVAVTDGRLVAVGGTAGGRPLKTVTALDLDNGDLGRSARPGTPPATGWPWPPSASRCTRSAGRPAPATVRPPPRPRR